MLLDGKHPKEYRNVEKGRLVVIVDLVVLIVLVGCLAVPRSCYLATWPGTKPLRTPRNDPLLLIPSGPEKQEKFVRKISSMEKILGCLFYKSILPIGTLNDEFLFVQGWGGERAFQGIRDESHLEGSTALT